MSFENSDGETRETGCASCLMRESECQNGNEHH